MISKVFYYSIHHQLRISLIETIYHTIFLRNSKRSICFLSRSQTKKEREVLRRVTSRFFVRSSSTSTIHILPSRTRVSGRAAKSPQQASSLTPLPGVYATLPPRRSKASRTTPTIRQNSATGTLTTKPVNKGKNGVFQVHAVH